MAKTKVYVAENRVADESGGHWEILSIHKTKEGAKKAIVRAKWGPVYRGSLYRCRPLTVRN